MLEGTVDIIDRCGVAGWAADPDRPDGVEDISIFVNGAKIAQTACALPRQDLRQLGRLGDGAHAFSFTFAEPLGTDREQRVTVRFTRSGSLLARGDAVVQPDGTVEDCTRARHRLIGEPGPIPAPRNPRGLLELLALCDDTSSMYDMLSRLDFTGLDLNQAHAMIFGETGVGAAVTRLPEPLTSFRDYANHLLLSERFQRGLIPVLLNAFPEKHRLFFIHVPKCAGTDFSMHLSQRFPSLHQQVTEPAWISKDDFFWALSRLMLNLRLFDTIFITGHNSLAYYSGRQLIRRFDRVVTILRDPLEIARSTVDYVMTRLSADAKAGAWGPDSRSWLAAIGREDLPSNMDAAETQALCETIFRCPEIVLSNPICQWLGGGTAQDVVRQLVAHDVELTNTENYADWLRAEWDIGNRTRMNRSEKIVSGDLIQRLRPYLQTLLSEDLKLYGLLFSALRATRAHSVRGRDLAEVLMAVGA